jgi:regulator of nucleoside diphosphate kinase
MHPSSLSSAFDENIWVIAQRAGDTPGQWVARCLNLDVVSISSSLQGALRAASEAVADCLRPGSAPLPRRRPQQREWSLVELLVRDGAHGQPPQGLEATAAAQLRLVRSSDATGLALGAQRVEQLPLVWLEDRVIAARQRSSALMRTLDFFKAPHPVRRRSARCGQPCPPGPSARGIAMSSLPEIILTTQDFDRLQRVVSAASSSAAERLDAELARAQLVAQTDIPADVVTMNSDVVYEDAKSGERRVVRLVYPRDAEADRGWVSVLAPIGSALLGLRQGQEIEWPTPSGQRRLRVVAVPYQPESRGDFAL